MQNYLHLWTDKVAHSIDERDPDQTHGWSLY